MRWSRPRRHSLGALASLHQLPNAGRAHRALADAEVAAELLVRIRTDLCLRFEMPEARHPLLVKIQSNPKGAMSKVVKKFLASA
jgi:DNA polymerase-3 subunit epsilon